MSGGANYTPLALISKNAQLVWATAENGVSIARFSFRELGNTWSNATFLGMNINKYDDTMIEEDLEIESGALIPSRYKASRGAVRNSTSICVEVSDEDNVYIDANGNKKVEQPRAKKAFDDYINLGPSRSLDRLANYYSSDEVNDWTDNFESNLRQLKRYSSNFDWQNRLRMLLTREAGAAISAARTEQARSRKGRISQAKRMQELGSKLIDRVTPFLADQIEFLDAKEATNLLKTAVSMLDIGLAAERIEIGETMDSILPPKPVAAMNDDELDEFIKQLTSQIT